MPLPFCFFTDSTGFAIIEICLSNRASLKQTNDFVEYHIVAKKDSVLLFFMKTETERGFCPILPGRARTERLGSHRKTLWGNRICGQKESRPCVG